MKYEMLPGAIDFCIEKKVSFLIARCLVNDYKVVHEMEKQGFHLMDTLIYFSRDLVNRRIPETPEDVVIHTVKAGQEEDVKRIARRAPPFRNRLRPPIPRGEQRSSSLWSSPRYPPGSRQCSRPSTRRTSPWLPLPRDGARAPRRWNHSSPGQEQPFGRDTTRWKNRIESRRQTRGQGKERSLQPSSGPAQA